MKTLIVDDVRLSRDGLAALIKLYLPEAEIVGSAGSVSDARKIIKAETLDIIFLDIQLQDGIGFDLLEDIAFNTKVIFITAYEQYAIEAVRKGAFDYLLKPINVEELTNCIQRIREINEIVAQQNSEDSKAEIFPGKIGISSMDGIDYVNVSDILYLKADGKYTEIILKNNKFISSKNLKMFEYLLSDKQFVRVHHSYIVNLAEVIKFKKDDAMLILIDSSSIPVSKSRKDFLLKKLTHI
jgi:two-component system LytT family response regulator